MRSIHRFAAGDLLEATRFYKREVGPGLARRFVNEFERIVKLLEAFPGIGTPSSEGRQSIPLTDFPYTVIYRHTGNEIRVLVLRHQSRAPDYGESRR